MAAAGRAPSRRPGAQRRPCGLSHGPALHRRLRPVYPRPMNLHSTTGGPRLAQQRHPGTEIPGPVSRELLERRVDLVIDGGAVGLEPTTIIDLTGEAPLLVRQGKGDVAHFGIED